MPTSPYAPCIPTRGTEVPHHPDWLHEIKMDGFRLIVERSHDRVRLFTRNGHNWTSRYPLIVEAARRIKSKQFVIDGEAVLLGVDGISDFDGLYSGKHNDEIQLYAFDILALDAMICGSFPSTFGRITSLASWHDGPMAFTSPPLNRARSGLICSAQRAI
jgi:bifunctional non-homologous end joining protein LigD